MPNDYFQFKKFTIKQDKCAMKIGTDAVLLGAWAWSENIHSVLDVGTGTGVIALMIAQRFQPHEIDAIEIEESAYLQAIENVNQSEWKDSIKVVLSDFQSYAKSSNKQYDLIVSNPPFFTKSFKTKNLEVNLARHNDQLPFIDLLSGVSKLLSKNGRFAVVLPYAEGCVFIAEAVKKALFCVRKTSVKSRPKTSIIRLLLEFSKRPEPCEEDVLLIHDDFDNDFSEKYKNLTKDFYLSI